MFARSQPLQSSSRRAGALALLAGLLLGAGCDTASPTAPGGGPPPDPGPVPGTSLASGEITVPAASERGDPGDHEPFRLVARIRPDLPPSGGQRLLVSLRDLDRPALVCTSPQPEDGCVSIDWSADPAEPGTPADGRFVNRLRVELASGTRDYFLNRSFQLADVPDRIDPAREHTAIGGTAAVWDTILPTDLVPGSDLELRVVLSKWQPPPVRIGFTVELLDG